MMILQAFENILGDPDKMSYYKQSPLLLPVFTALYKYKKAAYNFSDLPWFSQSKTSCKS
jgi:hypothetical protein